MIRPRLRSRIFGQLVALVIFAFARSGRAQQEDVTFFIDQLKNAADFRVRTQAALALGASDDPFAVSPLCGGLDDPNESVRSAAAAALAKLNKPSGLPCLEKHRGESNASVRAVIERSARLLQASAWPFKPPPPRPEDAFYVAIGPVTDKTGRADRSVSELVGTTMQEGLLSLKGYAVAPQGEPAAAALRIIRQKGLKGFLLLTKVEPPRSNGNDLTIQVRVTMWSYPGKALQGEFSPKLTIVGASAGDKETEDNLIKMAVEKAIESFARVTTDVPP